MARRAAPPSNSLSTLEAPAAAANRNRAFDPCAHPIGPRALRTLVSRDIGRRAAPQVKRALGAVGARR
ncbi:MAG TPA: hypothetical protein VGZ73_07535 [Bryobacteraceae bacterium]|nr:hypothetical protein [Bryobacteraceae bacterium]